MIKRNLSILWQFWLVLLAKILALFNLKPILGNCSLKSPHSQINPVCIIIIYFIATRSLQRDWIETGATVVLVSKCIKDIFWQLKPCNKQVISSVGDVFTIIYNNTLVITCYQLYINSQSLSTMKLLIQLFQSLLTHKWNIRFFVFEWNDLIHSKEFKKNCTRRCLQLPFLSGNVASWFINWSMPHFIILLFLLYIL